MSNFKNAEYQKAKPAFFLRDGSSLNRLGIERSRYRGVNGEVA